MGVLVFLIVGFLYSLDDNINVDKITERYNLDVKF